MAKISIFALSLALLLLFHGSIAVSARQQQQQQQQGKCQIRRLNTQEPTDRIQAEAGQTEFWDNNNDQFQCAGVSLIRHNIQPKGLLLPSYTNTPLLVYIEQGRGIQGIMLPGCPETFQSSQQERQQQQQEEQQGQGQRSSRQDRHQRIQQFRQGDIVAIPAGAAHWLYNDGDNDLQAVVLLDNANNANQLDQNPRRFFLAGNPRRAQQQQQQMYHKHRQSQQQQEAGNVFSGFDTQLLAEAFGVDEETARKLQGEQDERGHIVRVERGLQTVRPPFSREEEREQQRGRGRGNGLEETVCSARFRENIDDPSRADIYNPRAGRISTLDSFNLPILRHLQLSAERGVLQRNAIMAPHWIMNAHCIMYVTKGEARVQIVDHRGQAVFNDQVREGQVVVAPQNFAVLKQAGEQGFEWVAFRTNDNAMTSTLAGRTSALRGMPVDVIANAYQISREEAQRIKFNRQETILFSGSSSSGRRAVA